MKREYAAGGLVNRGRKLLLVRVCNLERRRLWTFPKGHLEKGETPLKAALREVREETGYRCRKTGALPEFRYRFKRDGRTVAKSVRWFRMEPVEKVGRPDPEEILSTRWVEPVTARRLLKYPSDLKLLRLVRKELPTR